EVLLALPHEGDLSVVVDDQLEEEVRQARLDRRAVAQQLGVPGAVTAAVEEGALQEVHEHPAGLVDERRAGNGRGVLVGRGVAGFGADRGSAHEPLPYRRGARPGARGSAHRYPQMRPPGPRIWWNHPYPLEDLRAHRAEESTARSRPWNCPHRSSSESSRWCSSC